MHAERRRHLHIVLHARAAFTTFQTRGKLRRIESGLIGVLAQIRCGEIRLMLKQQARVLPKLFLLRGALRRARSHASLTCSRSLNCRVALRVEREMPEYQ